MQRGICPDCLAEFAIGNVGADRHVIEHLLKVAELKSREAVIAWFQEHGVTLSDPETDEESGTISYIVVDEGESEAEILIGEDWIVNSKSDNFFKGLIAKFNWG